MAVSAASAPGRAVVAEAAVAFFGDEPGLLEEAQVARDAGLGEPEHAGQLRDVQPLPREHAEQTQARLVTQQTVQGRHRLHIY